MAKHFQQFSREGIGVSLEEIASLLVQYPLDALEKSANIK
jgi:hypothetical protein